MVDIIQPYSSFGNIVLGNSVQSSISNPISLFINGNTINGSTIPINARLTSSNGYDQNLTFNLQIGEVTVEDPLGPDEHGYYIYDSLDLGYSLAPIYDWIEIDNDFGGDGVNLNLSDSGDGNNINNSLAIIDLPFEFTFYGVTYDKITVNTNGWIAFGESNLESFKNYPIPGAGGPSPMLAVFWDDLKTGNNGEVYKYFGDNYVIVEWSEMRTLEPKGKLIHYYYAFSIPGMENKIQEMETLLAELKDGTGDSESLAVSGDHSFMIAPIVNTLGYFYYNIGNKEEAKNLFEEYLNLYPDGYNSYDSMGEFYYNEGDMENALKFYKKAKEMYPAATSANMMIEEISKS